MNSSNPILQTIDLGSFSSVWYWLILAVIWSSASHYVLGVPYDLINRARRHGGQAEIDLHDLVRINVNRIMHITGTAGLVLIGFVAFALTSLAVLGFWYGSQMGQAVFMVALPLTFVGALSAATGRMIQATQPEGDALYSILQRHRLWTQIIGMISIFVTGMYGMYQNLLAARFL